MGQLAILGLIAIGGAIGACSRYLVSEWCVTLFGRSFPYGTLSGIPWCVNDVFNVLDG